MSYSDLIPPCAQAALYDEDIAFTVEEFEALRAAKRPQYTAMMTPASPPASPQAEDRPPPAVAPHSSDAMPAGHHTNEIEGDVSHRDEASRFALSSFPPRPLRDCQTSFSFGSEAQASSKRSAAEKIQRAWRGFVAQGSLLRALATAWAVQVRPFLPLLGGHALLRQHWGVCMSRDRDDQNASTLCMTPPRRSRTSPLVGRISLSPWRSEPSSTRSGARPTEQP